MRQGFLPNERHRGRHSMLYPGCIPETVITTSSTAEHFPSAVEAYCPGPAPSQDLFRLGHLGFGQARFDDPPGQGGGVFAAVAAVLNQNRHGHLGVVGRGVGHEPGVIFHPPLSLLFGVIPINGDHLGGAGFAGHLDIGQAGGLGRCHR